MDGEKEEVAFLAYVPYIVIEEQDSKTCLLRGSEERTYCSNNIEVML